MQNLCFLEKQNTEKILNFIDQFVHLSMVFHVISNHPLLITVKPDLRLSVSYYQSDFCDS